MKKAEEAREKMQTERKERDEKKKSRVIIRK